MFANIPTVTKNLLIINVLAFLATMVLQTVGIDLNRIGGLYFFLASDFHLFQFVTYQFLHGGFTHLFFNMFALWMFGCVIEREWGAKKFLIYYIACGIFAGVCQELVQFVSYYFSVASQVPGASVVDVYRSLADNAVYLNHSLTIGASGAVYAILLAFGMTFPNERIFIFPIPIPIKAKWFVAIYAVFELFSATFSYGDGVAHMAHIGGMLSGYLLIRYWRKHSNGGFTLNGGRQFFGRWSNDRTKKTTWRNNFTTTSGFSEQTRTDGTSNDDMAYNARKKERQEEIDRILDKIRISGYDSLSKDEKRRLFEASRDR
ncbi:MAG: rhomboid family intramembrane serine protease [Prevotella sp.]|nr:rhomboid family intramembrane serine protease [Prevotella sp.]